MHTYIRLLDESLLGFRALMTSARARLIDLSASQAPAHSRLWAHRSDLFPHHFHPLASCGRIPVLLRLVPVWVSRGGLSCCRPIDLLGAHQRPSDSGILVGQGHGGPIPSPPFHQRPHPLAPAVGLPVHPAQTTPGSVHQQFAEINIAMFADANRRALPPVLC